jgi:hypothetical protein
MKLLFLDDSRQPYTQEWSLVVDYDSFVRHIEENGMPDVISWDHDLSFAHYYGDRYQDGSIPYERYNDKTGYHCAKYLVEKQLFPKLSIIHSLNPTGSMNIANLLKPYCKVEIVPFGSRKIEILNK